MKKLLQNLFMVLFLSGTAFAESDTECVISNFPYQLDLSELSVPNLPDCTSSFAVGASNDWSTTSEQGDFSFDGNTLMYSYSVTEAANAWFFTNGFLLEEGKSYKINYAYSSHNIYFNERLKVSYGTEANLSSMTNELANHSFNSKETAEHIIEVESTDVYYFSFLAHSIANQYRIYLGDISIDLVSNGTEDPCLISNIPYELEFTGETLYSLPECTSAENLGEGNQWVVTPFYGNNSAMGEKTLTYMYHYTEAADTWFYTHPIELEAGTHYELSYHYEGSDWPEKMKVAIGTDNSHEAMTQILADHTYIDDYYTNQVVFQIAEDGVYHVGFHAYSNANMNYLYLNNISLNYAEEGCFPIAELNAIQEDAETVALDWTAAEGTDSWEVRYASSGFNPETEGTSIDVLDTPETSITGLEADEAYDFYVRTICGEESSEWVSLLNFELEDLSICETPSDIQITDEGYGEFTTGDSGDTYVEISWTANNEETAWEVSYVLLDEGFEETIIEIYDTPELRIEGLIVGSLYEIKVRALCSEEKHSEWTTINYQTLPGASVEDEIFKDFSFYPNPTIDHIHISSELLINKISIYNILGQRLKEEVISNTDFSIDISDLANGQYLLQVEIEGYKKAFKILKN